MPFEERSIVSHREEFCRLALTAGANRRELCRRFGIGPATGYKWLDRFRAEGVAGLSDRSRRPLTSPERSSAAVEAQVLEVRAAHPAWGGRKIRRVLQNKGAPVVPSASTVTAILRRHRVLDGPGAGERRDWVRFEHAHPNDLWQMDFKGHFALGAGRCHPLTVLDDHSRYALVIGACGDERDGTVRERLAAAFERYGLPRRILSDNGPPWGSTGGELTALAVWLMDLGVGVAHGRPYHPQTQGKEERFHRSLKAEVLDGRCFASLWEAQAAFDGWRRVYNTQRPHEALGGDAPASRYRMSAQAMPGAVAPPAYEGEAAVRTVCQGGSISFKGRRIKAPKALAGKRVALRATTTDGLFDLCYRSHALAQVDLRQSMVTLVHHVSEHPSTLSPV